MQASISFITTSTEAQPRLFINMSKIEATKHSKIPRGVNDWKTTRHMWKKIVKSSLFFIINHKVATNEAFWPMIQNVSFKWLTFCASKTSPLMNEIWTYYILHSYQTIWYWFFLYSTRFSTIFKTVPYNKKVTLRHSLSIELHDMINFLNQDCNCFSTNH